MRKWLLVSYCVLFVTPVAFAQQAKSAPLAYVIGRVNVSRDHKSISFTAKITNISRKPVTINLNGLLLRVMYTKISAEQHEGQVSEERTLSVNSEAAFGKGIEKFFTLKPGASYIKRRSLKLVTGFFEPDYLYELRLIYGQLGISKFHGKPVWKGDIKSNKVKFQLGKSLTKI